MRRDTGDYTRSRSMRSLLDDGEGGPVRGGLLSADPMRTIGAVNPAEGLLTQPLAQPLAPRESLLDYMNQWGATTPMDWQSIAPHLAQLGIDPKGQDGARGWQYNGGNPQHDGGGGETPLWSLTPEAQPKLQGYTLGDREQLGKHNSQRSIYDPSGAVIGASQQDESSSMPWLEPAVMAALGAIAAPVAGAALGGGVIGGAAGGAATGGLLADAFDKDVMNGIVMGGLGGGLKGYMGGGGGGLDPFTPDSLKAWGQGAGVGVPDWESAISGINAPDLAQSFPVAPPVISAPTTGLDSFRQSELQGYQTDGSLPTSPAVPDIQPTAPVAQTSFRPSIDSQEYNQSSGITGQQAAQAATVPKTVNLVNAGGTMATSGGLSGATNLAAQTLRDLTASPEIGGSMLSQAGNMGANALNTVGSGLGTAESWAAKNPKLAKALFSLGGGLLASAGGGSSGGAPRTYGPAVKWNSPVSGIPQGLLGGGQAGQSGGQSGYPPAMGLLGGQPNSGAWRFLR